MALQAHRGWKVIECATGDCLSEDASDEARIILEAVVHVEDLRKKTTGGRLRERPFATTPSRTTSST